MLHGLLKDLEAWKTNLPENLKYRGPDTHRNAGERYFLITYYYYLSRDFP
jgi:hypothetical protein